MAHSELDFRLALERGYLAVAAPKFNVVSVYKTLGSLGRLCVVVTNQWFEPNKVAIWIH
jgi:hypothetical protein